MKPDIVLITVESWRYDYASTVSLDGFERLEGITAGHYTRPALAGLLGGCYRSAVCTRPSPPTLAETLQQAGYATIGVSYSPQTDRGMGFDAGFDRYEAGDPDGGPVARGSSWRERLATVGPVRAVHRRLYPKSATLDGIPSDEKALKTARARFSAADPPRFLWVHLMGTHRPYGRADKALSDRIDAKAAGAGPGRLQRSLTPFEHRTLLSAYRSAFERASERIRTLLGHVNDEAVVVIAGDHGEEFGEDGYYYHGGYRQRLVDSIVRVPIAVRNVDIVGRRVGFVDVASTLAGVAGCEPDRFDGVDRREHPSPGTLTVAPWGGRVAARWIGRGCSVVFDGDGVAAEKATGDVSSNIHERLQALGYASP